MRQKRTSYSTVKMKAIGIGIVILLVMIVVVKSDDDVDPVIDMLLNGVVPASTEFNEDDVNEPAAQFVGSGSVVWKCGNCTDLGNAKLMHTETNEVHADIDYIGNVEVQISLAMDAIRCITVTSEKAGVVRKVLGSCTGSIVTLSMADSNYTILVYK